MELARVRRFHSDVWEGEFQVKGLAYAKALVYDELGSWEGWEGFVWSWNKGLVWFVLGAEGRAPQAGRWDGVASSGCPVCILQMNVWRVESEVIGKDGLG